MPIFYYTGSGSISVNGCSYYYLKKFLQYAYKPGDVLFSLPNAKKGKLEKVVIKLVRVISKRQDLYGAYKFLYQDTLNGLWSEDELVTEANALLEAQDYYATQILIAQNAKIICGNKTIPNYP
jgi:hypothetical protein